MATTLSGLRFLNSVRIKTIVQTLASQLERARPLIYIDMLPDVNAFDDEIMGRFTGNIIAADLIADDQEAVVQQSGQVELSTHQIPNLKIGQRVGQAKLNVMQRLMAQGGRADEEDALFDWENMLAENLLIGVRQRKNALACAMFLDDFEYDRLGIKIFNASWGTPAIFKVTPSIPWLNMATTPPSAANPTTATPIDDIFALDQAGTDNYGIQFNRIIMSSIAFRAMVATTQFANMASLPLNAHFLVPQGVIPTKDLATTRAIAGQILNKEIILDDATYAERTNDGSLLRKRYLPHNKVLLLRNEDVGDPRIWDFANGVVTESIVGSLIDGSGTFAGAEYGPIAYYTGRSDLNPPDVVAWGVARGFPRKFVPEANAVLTIG